MRKEIIKQFRSENFGVHLGICVGLMVEHIDEEHQEAYLHCPHGLQTAFEYENVT